MLIFEFVNWNSNKWAPLLRVLAHTQSLIEIFLIFAQIWLPFYENFYISLYYKRKLFLFYCNLERKASKTKKVQRIAQILTFLERGGWESTQIYFLAFFSSQIKIMLGKKPKRLYTDQIIEVTYQSKFYLIIEPLSAITVYLNVLLALKIQLKHYEPLHYVKTI